MLRRLADRIQRRPKLTLAASEGEKDAGERIINEFSGDENMLISATLGVLVLVFQDGRLEGLLNFDSQGALNSTQRMLIGVIAFALSTDYAVFLLTRIKETRDAGARRHGGRRDQARTHRQDRDCRSTYVRCRNRRVHDV